MSQINYNTSRRVSDNLQRFDCLAWVNFNGTGTPAIRASGNVSSLIDNGVGDYTLNLAANMPDANYELAGSANNGGAAAVGIVSGPYIAAPAVGSVRIATATAAGGANADYPYVTVSIHR